MTFNKTIATIMGNAESATILQNIYFWVDKNKANEKHFYDGKYWTYNSAKAFSKQFPWLSEKQIRSHIQKLEEKGFIETGNYNKLAYDRTKWYTVTEKAIAILDASSLPVGNMENTQRENGKDPEGAPIPDINTDINTDNNTVSTKPRKNKYGEYKNVLLTQDEKQKLVDEWGECEFQRMLETFSQGLAMKGYKYKSHYLAIKKWKSRERSELGIDPSTQQEKKAWVIDEDGRIL